MVSAKGDNLGRFSVEVDLANYDDLAAVRRGTIPPEAVRRTRIRGVVDSGATRLVLPERVVDQLGLLKRGTVNVRYADGRTATRDLAQGIELSFLDRSSVFNAVVEPQRESALIGAIVLEDLDLLVDCTKQQLRPRDPKQIISEIEALV